MRSPTLSNARYRVRPRNGGARYQAWLVEQKSRHALRGAAWSRAWDDFSRQQDAIVARADAHLRQLRLLTEESRTRAATQALDANEAYNRIRASMVDVLSSSGRVHIGSWTRRWYALRRLFSRLRFWSRRHVD